MTKRKETVRQLLFGSVVSELVSKAETKGFNPDRAILLVLDGDTVRVVSSLPRIEVIGALQIAINYVLDECED